MQQLHIRYLSDAKSLCEEPDRIDNPGAFVTCDYADGIDSCWECSALLMAHNRKSFDKELLEMQNGRLVIMRPKHFKDERAAMWAGVLVGVCLMSFVFTLLWLLGAF